MDLVCERKTRAMSLVGAGRVADLDHDLVDLDGFRRSDPQQLATKVRFSPRCRRQSRSAASSAPNCRLPIER